MFQTVTLSLSKFFKTLMGNFVVLRVKMARKDPTRLGQHNILVIGSLIGTQEHNFQIENVNDR